MNTFTSFVTSSFGFIKSVVCLSLGLEVPSAITAETITQLEMMLPREALLDAVTIIDAHAERLSWCEEAEDDSSTPSTGYSMLVAVPVVEGVAVIEGVEYYTCCQYHTYHRLTEEGEYVPYLSPSHHEVVVYSRGGSNYTLQVEGGVVHVPYLVDSNTPHQSLRSGWVRTELESVYTL